MKNWDQRLRDIADGLPNVADCDVAGADIRNMAHEIGQLLNNQTDGMPQDVRDLWQYLCQRVVPHHHAVDLGPLVGWLLPRLQMLDDANETGIQWPHDLAVALGIEGNVSIGDAIAEVARIKHLSDTLLQDLKPTHRHIQRGTLYAEIGRAELQASCGPVNEKAVLVEYIGLHDGKRWVRPDFEFDQPDRFESL